MTVVSFEAPADMLTLNKRYHWRTYAGLVKEWRAATAIYARQQLGPTPSHPPSTVTVTLPVKGNRRRDPHNWTPTLKAICDGLVDAGVFPDDHAGWVATTEPVLAVDAALVEVSITPRETS